MNDELPSLKGVCATIQREEIRRKVMTRENPLKFVDNHACVAQKFAEKGSFKLAETRDAQHSAEKGFFRGKRPNL
ncbi:hypothetical protein ELC66_28540, partial [Klebsiella pneumoniae]|nr:hypothetical protein [Klebsiella pneumoniae]